MNALAQKLGWRGIIIFLAVVIILVIYQVVSTPSSQRKQVTIPHAPKEIKDASLTKWKVYTGKTYMISYPPDWKTEFLAVVGGEAAVIKPQNVPDRTYVPGLVIQTTQSVGDDSLEKNEEVYVNAFGFTQSDITVQNTPARQLKGIFPKKTVSGKLLESPLQETHIYFSKSGIDYLLISRYDGDKVNDIYENIFTQMFLAFKLTQ